MKKLAVVLMVFVVATAGFAGGAEEAGSAGAGAPTDLTVMVFDRGSWPAELGTVTDNGWTNWIQEQVLDELNVAVEFFAIPRAQERDRLNTLMAAGDAPDVIGTYFDDLVQNYAIQGGLADLTESIDEYGQNLMSTIPEEAWQYGQFERRQLMVPGRVLYDGIFADYIRQDWLDAVGLEVPTTREEWYEALVTIKEEDPGNIGSENIIGFWLDQRSRYRLGSTYASNFFWSFISDMSEEEFYTLPDLLKPGYKEGVQFLNRMYHEGLINEDFALETTPDGYVEAIATNRVASVTAAYWELFQRQGVETLLEDVPTAFYVGANMFRNDEGGYVREIRTPVGMRLVVPVFSESVDAAVQYLDWQARPEVAAFIWDGEEGVHHSVDANGFRTLLPEEDRGNDELPYQMARDLSLVVRNAFFDFSDPANFEDGLEYIALGDRNRGLDQIADMRISGARVSVVDGFTPPFYPTTIESAGRFGSVLLDKHEEAVILSILADPSEFSATYDRLVEEYMAAGGQEVMEEKMQVYNESIR